MKTAATMQLLPTIPSSTLRMQSALDIEVLQKLVGPFSKTCPESDIMSNLQTRVQDEDAVKGSTFQLPIDALPVGYLPHTPHTATAPGTPKKRRPHRGLYANSYALAQLPEPNIRKFR